MNLKTYLERKKLGPEEFGALIGRSRTVVYRYADGQRRPSLAIIKKIEEVTGGKVRFADWVA